MGKQTSVSTRGGNAAYYRQGTQRVLNVRGYKAGTAAPGVYRVSTPAGNQVSASLPERTYHRYILAEFIACMAMIAGGMILIPAQDSAQGGAAAGRSFARQLIQLTALCVVFFILALAGSGPKTGKVAAAFGGLVTLGVAWNLSEMWASLARALGGPSHENRPSPKPGGGA